jgi:hypothetical protein
MVDHLMKSPCTEDEEPSTAPESLPIEVLSPVSLLSNPLYSEMALPVLAEHCVSELNNYCRDEPCTTMYSIELIRRAVMQGDQEAQACLQHCFGGIVLNWLRRHPQRSAICRLESEEHYVAQAFERFWQATTSNQRMEFSTLTAALQYLRASLNGAILNTIRAYARPGETSLPEPGKAYSEDVTSSNEVWDILKTLFPNSRERRLAYLLFQCGLGPREIVHFSSLEFNDECEVYSLRRTTMERILRNADLLPWRLS